MTFVQGFFSFTINLTNSDRNVSQRLRFKIPRHPLEPAPYMMARVVAYTHCYQEGLEFSRGYFEPREPSLWRHSTIGEPDLIVEVGDVGAERIQRSIRHNKAAPHFVYFFDEAQIAAFCHGMRGSKTNWIEPIQFYKIDEALLERLITTEQSSSTWEMTIVDSHVYLTANSIAVEGDILVLDMWRRYQDSLEEGDLADG